MNEASKRFEYLVNENGLKACQEATVLVVGVGGVGSFAAEALARSFIGKIILLDNDVVATSNLNRQLIATQATLGLSKVEVMKERIKSINPDCEVIAIQGFYDADRADCFEGKVDFVVDAIDTLSSKMDLIEVCAKRNIPIISSLGMGNRLDPTQISITTLDKTSYDPLARALRTIVKKRNFKKKISVVFSKENPLRQQRIENEEGKTRKEIMPPGSSAFVPSTAGLICASYVVNQLIKKAKNG